MTSDCSSAAESADAKLPAAGIRSAVSLFLLIHLICLGVALSANLSPSMLQSRLLEVFGPYTEALNFDVGFTPFFLTQATISDVDHRIEVLPRGKDPDNAEDWIVLPDVGVPGSDRYRRYQRLAEVMAFFSESEAATALMAQEVASCLLRQGDVEPQQLRCRLHRLQPWDVVSAGTPDQRDANNETYFQTVYAANVLIDPDGRVSVVKIDAAAEVASPDAENK